jgi:hypothetical protein
MTLWREVFSTMEIIFVVKIDFLPHFWPLKVPSSEEAEDRGPTTSGEYPQ